MGRRVQVVVIGNNVAGQNEKDLAYKTGKIVGESGAILISGGKHGVMKYASKGAKEGGGLVMGILPDSSFENGNEYCDILIPTGIGYARNLVNILSGDLIIAIGGGAGTLSELAYAWQFEKTVFAFSCVIGWSSIIADMKKVDTKHDNHIISIDSISDFENQYFSWLNSMKSKGFQIGLS